MEEESYRKSRGIVGYVACVTSFSVYSRLLNYRILALSMGK